MKNLIRNILKEEIDSKSNRYDLTNLKARQSFWDWIRWHEGSMVNKGTPMLKSYKDSVGVWTIGYGHTGNDVKRGMIITNEKANVLFKNDLNDAADCVKRFLSDWGRQKLPGAKLKVNEYEALISLVFNSGCENVRTSDFIQKIKYGKFNEAAELIKTYKSSGLEKRRNSEYELFKNDIYLKE